MENFYVYSNFAYSGNEPNAVLVGSILLGLLLFSAISYCIISFLLGRVFNKAGVPQWAAWVPVYNVWKLLEIGGQPPYWAIIAVIPFVGIIASVFMYMAMHEIGKKLGKDNWFVLLAIFLPVAWLIWLGFDDSKWNKKLSK